MTSAAKERATALQDDRRIADSARQKALHEERARVRAEVEKTWAAKLREANDAADLRFESGLRAAHEEADRQLVQKVASVRGEGQKVLAAVPVTWAPEPAPAEPQTDEILGRVLDGVRRLDQATRLTDVLDTLADLAGNEAPRAAVLTVQAGDVCSVVSGPNGVPRDAEPAFTTLPLGVHALSVPVLVGGQVMAVVYGDDAERRPAAGWRESLEVLARHAGHCLEALTAARAAQLALQDFESPIPEDAGPTLPFDEAGVERPKPDA